jgi:hypothetical protein
VRDVELLEVSERRYACYGCQAIRLDGEDFEVGESVEALLTC